MRLCMVSTFDTARLFSRSYDGTLKQTETSSWADLSLPLLPQMITGVSAKAIMMKQQLDRFRSPSLFGRPHRLEPDSL